MAHASSPARRCDLENGFRKNIRGIFIDSVAEAFPPCDPADIASGAKVVCERDYYQTVVDHIKNKCDTPESGDVMVGHQDVTGWVTERGVTEGSQRRGGGATVAPAPAPWVVQSVKGQGWRTGLPYSTRPFSQPPSAYPCLLYTSRRG